MLKKLTVILFLITCISAYAATEFKIITLQHSFASDLLPLITPMVGPNGTATGVNNQLILRAEPARMREIEALVQSLDQVKVNRRITIDRTGESAYQRNRTEVNGTIKTGKVIISNDRRSRPNTGRIDIERHTRSARHNSSQFLNVLDGQRAFIRVGQAIPFTQDWITITSQYVAVSQVTHWQDVSTGFAVRPRTIGNQVELEITPRIASLNSQGYIDFEELSTVVNVQLGEWVDIANTMQNSDNVSRKILGSQSSGNYQSSVLSIRVD